MCFLITAGMIVGALFVSRDTRIRLLFLAGSYLVTGVIFLLLRLLFARRAEVRHSSGRRGTHSESGRRGSVLVMVLVLVTLAALLVTESQVIAALRMRLEGARLRNACLRAALTDSALRAIERLGRDRDFTVDYIGEEWGCTVETTRQDGVAVFLKLEDENRRFDVNNIFVAGGVPNGRPAAEIVQDIMTVCGDFTPITRVQALRDWIDPDEEGFRESDFYRDHGAGYGCRNRWLACWPELLLVDGFSRDYFRPRPRRAVVDPFHGRLLECLALIPGGRTRPVAVNVNTAGRDVLTGVFGLENAQIAEYIVNFRRDHPLVSLAPLAPVVPERLMKRVRPYLAVRSEFFSIRARASREGAALGLRALLRRKDGGGVQVLQWVMM